MRHSFADTETRLPAGPASRWKTFVAIGVMLLSSPLLLVAGGKKEQQEQMRRFVEMMQMEEATHVDIPDILKDDQKASDYCRGILFLTDEQYSQDTATVNAIIRNAQWISARQFSPDEKTEKKLIKKKYDPQKLLDIYQWADMVHHLVHPRYAILTGFCEKQLQRRRDARKQTMPTGRLVRFAYNEHGSSRPTPVDIVLECDSASGRWLLNGREVADSVAVEVRSLAEQHQTYKCLRSYAEPPIFPQAPPVMGGPPSWFFSCKFEGGTIYSESECMPVPYGCAMIVEYLNNVLRKICKNQQD